MTPTHIDEQLLIGYCDLAVTAAAAAAIEAHLMNCATCRVELGVVAAGSGDGADGPERMWNAILERVDRPRRSITERLLGFVGVRDDTARLLATTPALRLAWLVAVGLVAAFAVTAAGIEVGDPWPLLVLAPLLPLAGVATAYGPALDPTYEIGVAAPMSAMRLTLLRTLAVLATTMPVLLIATVAAPGAGWAPLGWLLPAFALVSMTLALSTWILPERAGVIVGVAWLVSVVALVHRDQAGDFLATSMIFTPTGQAVTAALAVAGAATAVGRKQNFDWLTVGGGRK